MAAECSYECQFGTFAAKNNEFLFSTPTTIAMLDCKVGIFLAYFLKFMCVRLSRFLLLILFIFSNNKLFGIY